MILRSATEKDIDIVVDIESQTLREKWGRNGYLSHLRLKQYFTVVIDNDQVVGFCVAQGVKSEWELYKIVIDPHFQRRGYARKLLENLESYCGGTLFLEVRESNSGAQKFYIQQGFHKIGIRRAYYRDGENACLYQK